MAITFDGVDDVINCGSADTMLQENAAQSVSAWIKPTTIGTVNGHVIISKANSGTATGILFFLSSVSPDTKVIQLTGFGATPLVRKSNNNSVSEGVWQHVLYTWDGSTTASNVHIYVNGVEVGYQQTQNYITPGNNAADTISIGNRSTIRTFNGLITEVAVFNKVLSASEIAQLYGGGTVPKGLAGTIDRSALKGYWPMNENTSGTVPTTTNYVRDFSEGGNHGTQANNPVYSAEPSNLPYRTLNFNSTKYASTLY